MTAQRRALAILPALLCATLLSGLLSACGGGSSASSSTSTGSTTINSGSLANEAGAPALTNNSATDGFNWFNYRRQQMGVPVLARNSLIDAAAQGHSNYQKINNAITHVQTVGASGFTGATELDRLTNAGYLFNQNNAHAYGEVISATTDTSGFFMAEQLIAAIYHRFVIFEPVFKEIGTGAATVSGGYTYFTADLTANNGYGAGLGSGNIAVYPFDGQQNVPLNFLSDYESPDPVPNQNEVGYPVSVHANIDAALVVQNFTITPRGGTALTTRLLTSSSDSETPPSAAAIIPLTVLTSGTTYTVSFSGLLNNAAVSKTWTFTTR